MTNTRWLPQEPVPGRPHDKQWSSCCRTELNPWWQMDCILDRRRLKKTSVNSCFVANQLEMACYRHTSLENERYVLLWNTLYVQTGHSSVSVCRIRIWEKDWQSFIYSHIWPVKKSNERKTCASASSSVRISGMRSPSLEFHYSVGHDQIDKSKHEERE